MSRSVHPVWIRPKPTELEMILGDCLASPINTIDVTVANNQLEDPRITAEMHCLRYLSGAVIEGPFPLMDSADTNAEQTRLGLDTVQEVLNGICSACSFRSSVG